MQSVRKKSSVFGTRNSLFLHDNASTQKAKVTVSYLDKQHFHILTTHPRVQTLPHASSDFFFFFFCIARGGECFEGVKLNTSHGNEVLPQDITHLLQRPCYQRGSPCQDPAGNWTTRRPPDHRKETQTAVVWSCLQFNRSAKTILHGTVKGGRKQGIQRKRWEDNKRE